MSLQDVQINYVSKNLSVPRETVRRNISSLTNNKTILRNQKGLYISSKWNSTNRNCFKKAQKIAESWVIAKMLKAIMLQNCISSFKGVKTELIHHRITFRSSKVSWIEQIVNLAVNIAQPLHCLYWSPQNATFKHSLARWRKVSLGQSFVHLNNEKKNPRVELTEWRCCYNLDYCALIKYSENLTPYSSTSIHSERKLLG